MKYYKCKLCGFEFCRVGQIENCVMCGKSAGLRHMKSVEQEKFIEKYIKIRKK